MPFLLDDDVNAGFVEPTPLPGQQPAPSVGETVGAAVGLFNWPVRLNRHLLNREGVDLDLDHNPFELIRGTIGESDPVRFAGSRNEAETRALLREMEEDERAREIYARSGWFGTVAAIGAGLADPTIFLPVGKIFSGTAQGYRALRISGDAALAGAGAGVIAESGMAVTTPEHTASDFVQGVATGTILAGLLGGAVGLLTPAERRAAEDGLQTTREEWGAEIDARDPSAMAPVGAPRAEAAGAAPSETRSTRLARTGFERVDFTAKISPPRRVLSSPFPSARRATVDLVEVPYSITDNAAGVATTQGPALDRLMKLEIGKVRVALTDRLEDSFTRYRFGEGGANFFARKAASASDFLGRPSEKLSYGRFKEEIDRALRSGDTHEIPEVAEAAQFIRSRILDPWKDRAIKAGLLDEDVAAVGADSYMMRVWNKQALGARRPDVVQRFTDWLGTDQTRKARLRDELDDLSARLDEAEADLARIIDSDDVLLLGYAERGVTMLRGQIEERLEAWGGKSAREAVAAIGARNAAEEARGRQIAAGRYAGREKRLTGADKAVSAAVRKILASDRDLSADELRARAEEIVDRILSGADGRLPYDAPSGGPRTGIPSDGPAPRGPLAAREFAIPDEMVAEFLDRDIENTLKLYMNTVVPDVLLTERFGDVDMTEVFRKLNVESTGLVAAAKTEAARVAIETQRQAVIADLAAMRDRVRHTYGFSSDPRMRRLGLITAAAARFDVLTNLGGAVLSSTADLAGAVYRYGFASTFRNAWVPFARAIMSPEARKALGAQRRQLRALGIAAETYLQTRAHGLSDVLDVYRPQSRFERGLTYAAENYSLANLVSPWTDFAKFAAGMIGSAEIAQAAEAIARGTAKKRQVKLLAESGIDGTMARRIWAEMEKDGGSNVVDGIRISNSGAWTDTGARDAFEGALARDVDIMVLTPGAERPLLMSNPIAGLVLQYKSFVVAAHERILMRGLQMHDAATAQGLVAAVALGCLSEYGYTFAAGREPPQTAPNWIKAGLNRSGVLGWLGEINNILAKVSSNQSDVFRLIGADAPDSRFISRSILGAVLGPTANKLESIGIVTGKALAMGLGDPDKMSGLNWTEADTSRVRRLMLFQNHLLLRRLLFDNAEESVNEFIQ